jgi:hypothetical protein
MANRKAVRQPVSSVAAVHGRVVGIVPDALKPELQPMVANMPALAAHMSSVRSLQVGMQFVFSALMAAPKMEGRARMPFAQPRLAKLVGGALIALTICTTATSAADVAAASLFAGTYTGTIQPVPGNDPSCSPGGDITFQVQDGRFRFPWHEPQAFDVRISSDGSFFATSGNLLVQADKHMMLVPTMQGRVAGTKLVADYGTRWCRYQLEVTRS